MLATGIRVGELCRLRVEDIAPDGSSLRIQGKGSRDRVAYIADSDLRRELREQLQLRERMAGSYCSLFVNRLGFPLRPQTVRVRLRKFVRRIGITRRVTPHMLRHTAATFAGRDRRGHPLCPTVAGTFKYRDDRTLYTRIR